MIDIIQRIHEKESEFSRQQHTIALIILESPNEAAMWNLQTLARKAMVSDATVLRFARTLGFSGYPEMRSVLQQRIIDDLTSWRRVQQTLSQNPEEPSILRQFMEQQLDLLRQLVVDLPFLDIERFSEKLVASKNIWIYGQGAAETPARALEFWLQRFGLSARTLVNTGRRLLDSVSNIGEQDSLVLFVFGVPSNDAAILVDWAHHNGAVSLVVTDISRPTSEHDAEIVIRIARGPAGSFHSMALPVAIADTIALQCARFKGAEAVKAVRRIDEARKRYGIG